MQHASLHLFDSASREILPLALRKPGEVSVYVCGPTVYDHAHLGHGRSMLTYDVLRRYLTHRGLDVTLVSNVTDVDDKIVQRAAERGEEPIALAKRFEDSWNESLAALGVDAPTVVPHATEYIPQMVQLVEDLLARGVAYVTDRGVLLDTSTVEGYGLLAHQDLDEMREGARIGVDSQRRNKNDFYTWKLVDDGLRWDSPWGPGRPGWHSECVAMSLDVLGGGFDLHAGGMDLAFPHHENERAQILALGEAPSAHWMHHAFVEVDGARMGKSMGNYVNLRDLLQREDPMALRLLVLQAHYRSPLEVLPETLKQATSSLQRIRSLLRRHPADDAAPDADRMVRFHALMDQDLDTPGVMALLFETVREANSLLDAGADASGLVAFVREILSVLGITGDVEEGLPAEVAALALERDLARSRKEWKVSDDIRARLQGMGYRVEDTPAGTRVHR